MSGSAHAPIAGSVLPIRRAEELLTTLPGILSAKIVASDSGAVEEIHVLTTSEYTPKQTVRNIESALIAHLGMRVDHRKISVAASSERAPAPPPPVAPLPAVAASVQAAAPVAAVSPAPVALPPATPAAAAPPPSPIAPAPSAGPAPQAAGPRMVEEGAGSADRPAA